MCEFCLTQMALTLKVAMKADFVMESAHICTITEKEYRKLFPPDSKPSSSPDFLEIVPNHKDRIAPEAKMGRSLD
jgi:hypothetical protein